ALGPPRAITGHQDESPRQPDAKIVHQPLVVRGKAGHGAPTLQCNTCHQATNTADGFVPGVATWGLAPLSMLWEGKTKAQICEQIKDPARNGGRRTGEEVIEHMKHDPLVLWAWSPGANRTTPPLSHDAFVAAPEAWAKAGMPCPKAGQPPSARDGELEAGGDATGRIVVAQRADLGPARDLDARDAELAGEEAVETDRDRIHEAHAHDSRGEG